MVRMDRGISHDRRQETPQAKARWFQTLSLAERMDYLCAITDLAFENNPQIADRKLAQPTSGRIRILSKP